MEVTTLVRTVGLDLLKPALPQRQLDGHKGTFGKLLIVGGAVGYTGAPYLTASAAARCGSTSRWIPVCPGWAFWSGASILKPAWRPSRSPAPCRGWTRRVFSPISPSLIWTARTMKRIRGSSSASLPMCWTHWPPRAAPSASAIAPTAAP